MSAIGDKAGKLTLSNGTFKVILLPSNTTCETQPTNAQATAQLNAAVDDFPAAPVGGVWKSKNCGAPPAGTGSNLITFIAVARNPDGSLSTYAQATGLVTVRLQSTGNTPSYNVVKNMASDGGPWSRAGLFDGAATWGGYHANPAPADGQYYLTFTDTEGKTDVYLVTLSGTDPFSKLKGTNPTGGGGTTPTDPEEPTGPPPTVDNTDQSGETNQQYYTANS